ncbi:MAG: methionine synthase [Jatrophihabitans sp.]|nr:MAG: methionine synthase [Jatrophihabitans sp.]
MSEPAWPAGAATGIGSLPGTDAGEAVRLVFGELPDLPHLPELPARGPGASMVGRGAALLVDLPVELAATRWTLTGRPGRDLRRARDLLERDLDVLQAEAAGYAGVLKVQAAGPWTLAAGIELASGHTVVSDPGAVRDLSASLTEGLRLHLADLARRVPGATFVLQVDEPSLPAVLAGRIPTPSGYGTVRAVGAETVTRMLRPVLEVAGHRVVHCCAPEVPVALLRDAGADAVSLDASLLTAASYDALGEAVDAGTALWLGTVPAIDAPISLDLSRSVIQELWSALGFPLQQAADVLVPTPACGLAGASPRYARRALTVVRDTGRWLADESR